MPLHFPQEELAARRTRVITELSRRGLDGLLIFKPESQYYLTGYDSTGFLVFQCLLLNADGRLTLLTRAPDVAQAAYTSMLSDVRVWADGAGVDPTLILRDLVQEHGLMGKRLGIELETFGLRAHHYSMMQASFSGRCELVDASDLVNHLRLIKSEAELAYVRRAAELADEALVVANELARPGTPEGELYASMHSRVFRGGGFYPASRWAIGSGNKALLVRTTCDTNVIGNNDQVQLEFAATFRHYHAGLMRTILTGRASSEHQRMHAACIEALAACKEVCRPGGTVGDIFAAHARTYDRLGLREQRFNACGYSLGATYAPSWMDWPMIHAGSDVRLEPGMVFFLLMILVDRTKGLTMSVGETVCIGKQGCVTLSAMRPDLVVN